MLAAGFDSRVNDRGNRTRWPRGPRRYDLAVLAVLAALRPMPFRLRLDGGPWREIEATLIAVGNGASCYGGGMRIRAGARVDDGLSTVTVVGDVSRTTLPRVFPRVHRGTHLAHPAVSVREAARLEIDAPASPDTDGEPLGPLPLTAACVAGAVRPLAPVDA